MSNAHALSTEAAMDVLSADLTALKARLLNSPVWKAPQWTRTHVSRQTERLTTPDQARQCLSAFAKSGNCFGWIETPKEVLTLTPGSEALPKGVLLHAELCAGAESIQLHWADGEWVITTLVEHGDKAPAGAQAVWRTVVTRPHAQQADAEWVYHLYFSCGEQGELNPAMARLAGVQPN